jgi:hypothetical protein
MNSQAGLLCPFSGQGFRLLQDGLNRSILKVGRVAILAKDALDQNAHAGAGGIAVHPVLVTLPLTFVTSSCAMTRSLGSPMGSTTPIRFSPSLLGFLRSIRPGNVTDDVDRDRFVGTSDER